MLLVVDWLGGDCWEVSGGLFTCVEEMHVGLLGEYDTDSTISYTKQLLKSKSHGNNVCDVIIVHMISGDA